ncbi:MAG: 23S rRNA (guanosine(2251)-2'-O)-methyltransferase RlmB [Christensenellales bacterium]
MRTQDGQKQHKQQRTKMTQKTKKTQKKEYLQKEKSLDVANDNLIFGRNSVIEALEASRKLEKVLVLDGGTGSLRKIIGLAKASKVRVEFVDRKTLDRLSGGANHQGVVAKGQVFEYSNVDSICEAAATNGEDPFILILDGIEDPHNLGAILRTGECAGVHGIIIPERRAASVDSVAMKVAAGAAEYVKVARVKNLSRTLDELKNKGVWIVGLDMYGERYYEQNLKGPIALVVGNEGKGISRLIKEKCDYMISIPLKGKVSSLNASNAVAVAVYETLKQRETC